MPTDEKWKRNNPDMDLLCSWKLSEHYELVVASLCRNSEVNSNGLGVGIGRVELIIWTAGGSTSQRNRTTPNGRPDLALIRVSERREEEKRGAGARLRSQLSPVSSAQWADSRAPSLKNWSCRCVYVYGVYIYR